MALLTTEQLRNQVSTGLTDPALQAILDREEAELVRRIGAHPDGVTAVVEMRQPEALHVYLCYPVVSVSSVEERALGSTTWATVTTNAYEVDPGSAYLELVSGTWGARVRVTYIPTDQRPRRAAALIEIIRLALERTAMKSENIAGEYSYTAPEWDIVRADIYRTLGFMEV